MNMNISNMNTSNMNNTLNKMSNMNIAFVRISLSRFRRIDDDQIMQHLEAMPDDRSEECRQRAYDGLGKDTVSIILDFHEHQFYDLRVTLESILKFTPDHMYKEIVLLDDGSGDIGVKKTAERYLAAGKFKKVKAFRSEQSHGPSLSRFKASRVATGSIQVFLSSEVVVTKGWIEPLVQAVQHNRRFIIVPHTDSILSAFRYSTTPDNLVNVFSWTLTTLYYETKETGDLRKTPIMTGAAFAVDKEFLDGIGSFDEGLGKGGGESLELSIRAWMCGAGIKISSCSRVAVRNALEPHEITSPKNFQRIVELWFADKKRLAYRQKGHTYEPNEMSRQSLNSRHIFLKKTTTCGEFGDYLDKVATMVLRPPANARHFGKLQDKTGSCLYSIPLENKEMKMVPCRPHMYEPTQLFEFDNLGRISRTGKCVEVEPDGNVNFVTCQSRKADQMWEYQKNGMISNAAKTTLCLCHVTTGDRQHKLGTAPCAPDDNSHLWKFVKY